MSGAIIISLDCEGKWGVADRPSEGREFITTPKLTAVYAQILKLFEKHQFRATFAFVSAMTYEADELWGLISGVELPYKERDWLRNPLEDIGAGRSDGWCAPLLIQEVMSRGVHHLCAHGGTHVPYDDEASSANAVQWDLHFAKRTHQRLGLEWKGLVFPRNIVGHLDSVHSSGIRYYRKTDPCEELNGVIGRATRLANEFISADRFGLHRIGSIELNSLAALSSGKFINARIGLRSAVSKEFTMRRVDALLRHAVSYQKIVHLYTHPHNFISDPALFGKLDAILKSVSSYVSRGELQVMTMEDEHNAACDR